MFARRILIASNLWAYNRGFQLLTDQYNTLRTRNTFSYMQYMQRERAIPRQVVFTNGRVDKVLFDGGYCQATARNWTGCTAETPTTTVPACMTLFSAAGTEWTRCARNTTASVRMRIVREIQFVFLILEDMNL